jgi:hypothetical protein
VTPGWGGQPSDPPPRQAHRAPIRAWGQESIATFSARDGKCWSGRLRRRCESVARRSGRRQAEVPGRRVWPGAASPLRRRPNRVRDAGVETSVRMAPPHEANTAAHINSWGRKNMNWRHHREGRCANSGRRTQEQANCHARLRSKGLRAIGARICITTEFSPNRKMTMG